MSTTCCVSAVEQIGEAAGSIWHLLNEQGPTTLTKLSKTIEAPRDVVMQAIGWLAREGKIAIEDGPRAKTISLAR